MTQSPKQNTADIETVWARIADHAGLRFRTITGLEFTYEVPGNYLLVSGTVRDLSHSNFAKALARCRRTVRPSCAIARVRRTHGPSSWTTESGRAIGSASLRLGDGLRWRSRDSSATRPTKPDSNPMARDAVRFTEPEIIW
jgi:hypothetical protein